MTVIFLLPAQVETKFGIDASSSVFKGQLAHFTKHIFSTPS